MQEITRRVVDGLEEFRDDRADRQVVRAVGRAVVRQHGRAVVAAARADAAAHVVRTALINTAMLSKDEEQMCSLAPMGEFRYKMIVDAYALYAVRLIGEL